jgi:hypothetical protein
MKATQGNATSKAGQSIKHTRPQAPKEKSTHDRQKLMHVVRRCNTNLALIQNMKVFDALQLTLHILNDKCQACSIDLDQVEDE